MFINEMVCQQVRQLLRMKRRFGVQHVNQVMTKRRRIRGQCPRIQRCTGGQDRPTTCTSTQTLTPQRSIPISTRPAVQPVGNRCIVPLLHIWMRLHSISSISSPLIRQRCVYRFRLQQRSLLQNVRYAVSVRWNTLIHRYFPPPDVSGFASQTEKRQTPQNKEQSWIARIISSFKLISQNLEGALVNVGPRSFYINTSASMEVINVRDIFNDLNSVLIEYLVQNDENITGQSLFLTPLSLL